MPKLDRYLIAEFAQATLATFVVMLIVSFGGVVADVLGDVAAGRVPVGLMLPQLGLQLIKYLPLVLPLALMLGMMLAAGRLYRDSEMPVIAAAGVGPRRLLKPVLSVVLPVVAIVAACSLWLGPWADRTAKQLVNEANRNLIVAGLQPGRFTALANGGVVYIGSMSTDGSRFRRVFIYRQSGDRLDVTTSDDGELTVDKDGQRYIVLKKGFEVEGPLATGLDYNLLRYQRNDVLMPTGERKYDPTGPKMQPTLALLDDPSPGARAQLHYRIAPPLLTLAFALLALPLARSTPRQARYGRMLMGFLTYLVGMELMLMGTTWIEKGKTPAALGLWWLVLPLLAGAIWLYLSDGRMRRPRRSKARAGARTA